MGVCTGYFLLDLLGVVTALVAVGYAYFKWSYQYWKNKNVPYLEPSIPFGTESNPFKSEYSVRERIQNTYNYAKSKRLRHVGTYSMIQAGYVPVDLELIKHIMTKDFSHFVDRGMYSNEKIDPLSAHLFALGGKRWRNLRVKLTPTFTSGKLKAMFQTLVDCGLTMENYIKENITDKDPVDIKELLGRLTTNIIGSCAFGIDCNTFKEPNSPFRVYATKFPRRSKRAALELMLAHSFPRLGKALGIRITPKDVEDFYTKVVKDTIDYRLKNNYSRKDLLQLLIDMMSDKDDQDGYQNDESTMNIKEIVAQCFLFFLAGFETSSTTMTFALYQMALHSEIQEKAREELKTVLGKYNGEMTYDSLNELKYMKQIIDETLRMYPPLPVLARTCVEKYKIPGEDIVLDVGVRVVIPVAGLHFDEDYFKDPNTFDPERFTEENKKNIPQYSYLPFGEGPRICIGERFGIMQTKVGLACILKNFKVSLSEKTIHPIRLQKRNFIPVAEGGIWLKLTPTTS